MRCPTCPGAHGESGIAGELGKPFRRGIGVSGLDEKPVDAVPHDVRHAADAGRHNRCARGERLDRAHRRPFVDGRQEERVEEAVVARDLLLVSDEIGRAGDPEVVG